MRSTAAIETRNYFEKMILFKGIWFFTLKHLNLGIISHTSKGWCQCECDQRAVGTLCHLSKRG